MSMIGFLANIGENFRNHYLRMANDMFSNRTPEHFYRSTPLANQMPTDVPTTPADGNVPADRWDPSPQAQSDKTVPQLPTDVNKQTAANKTPTAADAVPTDEFVPNGEIPVKSDNETPVAGPDGTYSLMRHAHLDYKLNLRFDLAAISRTARYLASGDTTDVDQMSAAGFGLSADFALKGFEITKSNLPDAENGTDNVQAGGVNRTAAQQAGLFQANSRNFALNSFYREATKQRQSTNVLVRDGYRRSVNKFAFRFKMDSKFSFANLQRFNVQTKNVAKQMPESLGKYVDVAGDVAQGGTNDMMAAFFDSVDAYLNQSEDQLVEKTVAAFDQAANQLGFSGPMVDAARENLTDSIGSFFDRVDTAMANIRSQFAPESVTPPEVSPEEPQPMPGNVTDMDRLSEPTQPMQA